MSDELQVLEERAEEATEERVSADARRTEYAPLATETDVDALRAHVQTLQCRVEALERQQRADAELRLKVRRAIGALAAAFGLVAK